MLAASGTGGDGGRGRQPDGARREGARVARRQVRRALGRRCSRRTACAHEMLERRVGHGRRSRRGRAPRSTPTRRSAPCSRPTARPRPARSTTSRRSRASRAPRGGRLVVDAITSLGVHPLPQDAWGIDVVVCGSQKGLMIAARHRHREPGAVGGRRDRGRARCRASTSTCARRARARPLGETAFTPPVSLVLALEEALRDDARGRARARARAGTPAWRARCARARRRSASALFSPSPSNAVTALTPPAGVEPCRGREAAARGARHGGRRRAGPAEGQDPPRRPHGRLRPGRHRTCIVAALEECVASARRPAPRPARPPRRARVGRAHEGPGRRRLDRGRARPAARGRPRGDRARTASRAPT